MELYDQYDVKSLYVLKVVIEEKSRSKAARKLGIKESSLHYRLEKLREQTKDQLVKTENGVVKPTKRGATLYKTACDIHGILKRELENDATFDYTQVKKDYTILCNDLFASLVAPYLIDKAHTLNSVKFSLYIVPDIDASLLGHSFGEFYYSLMKSEQIDLVITSDFGVMDYPGLKRSKIMCTSATQVFSEMNRSTLGLDQESIPGGEVCYIGTDEGDFKVSSFRVIEDVVRNTLMEGPVLVDSIEEQSDMLKIVGQKCSIDVYQYWYGDVVDDKSHAFLRKLIKSVCSELNYV